MTRKIPSWTYLCNAVPLQVDDTGNSQLDTAEHRDHLQYVVIKRRRQEVLNTHHGNEYLTP